MKPSTERKAFTITGGRGFQMVFANGWSVSVQFGIGNYCDNRNNATAMGDRLPAASHTFYSGELIRGAEGCANAETALLNPDGDLVAVARTKRGFRLARKADHEDTVQADMSAADVLALMQFAAGRKGGAA